MNAAYATTYYTLREMMRRKLLWIFAGGGALLAFGLGLVTLLAPREALGGNSRSLFVVVYAGQACEIFLFLTAVGIGATVIYNDLDSGSIVSIFTKPVSRLQYTLAKLAAALVALLGVSLVLALGLLVIMEVAGGGHEDVLFIDIARIVANQATVLILILTLTAVTNNIVSVVLTVVVTNIANIVNAFWLITRSLSSAPGWTAAVTALHWILPRQIRYTPMLALVGLGGVRSSGLTREFYMSDWTDVLYWGVYLVLLVALLYLLVRRKQV
jgi:ABC-type transport system involved in multi-copper enzyme maturation permease subunit